MSCPLCLASPKGCIFSPRLAVHLSSLVIISAPPAGPQRTQIRAVNNEASLPPVCSDYHFFFFFFLPSHSFSMFNVHVTPFFSLLYPAFLYNWLLPFHFCFPELMISFSALKSLLLARSPAWFLLISPVCFAFFITLQHAHVNSINQATENIERVSFLIFQVLERSRRHVSELQVEEVNFSKLCYYS